MRSWKLWVVALVTAVALGSLKQSDSRGNMPWINSLSIGRKISLQRHQMQLIFFSSASCEWCAKMENTTFSNKEVLNLAHSFTCIHIDGDVNNKAVSKYRVMAYPTLIITDAKGDSIYRFEGYLSSDQLKPLLKALLQDRR